MKHQNDIVAAIASMKTESLILSIGVSALNCQSTVVECMDSFSRLVVNLPPELPIQNSERSLESDIRVAIHRQDFLSFLGDIEHHQLNFVVVGGEEVTPDLLQKIVSMLSETGCLLILNRSDSVDEICSNLNEYGKRATLNSTILFVRVEPRKPRVRKGGRRSRSAAGASSDAGPAA